MYNQQRINNISKIKYYLPNRDKYNTKQNPPSSKNSNENIEMMHYPTRKEGIQPKINFQILGVNDSNNKVSEEQNKTSQNNNIAMNNNILNNSKKQSPQIDIASMFPEGPQKQKFYKFLETLQDDYNYQNTITMFTIMYYYQKINKKR